MAVAVSVVVIAKDFRHLLGPLVESLDLQSLPTTDFEVVLVDLGSTDGTAERLRQLTSHRSNVQLLEAESLDGGQWLSACSGQYVLRLRPDQTLLPEALQRMYDLAVQHDLDAVSARVSQPGAPVPELFTVDQAQVPDELVPVALAAEAVLIRHSLLDVAADPGTDSLRVPTRVGVLASYPALVQPAADADPGAAAEDAALTLRQDQPAGDWDSARLRLSVSGVVTGAAPAGPVESRDAPRGLAVLRHTTTGMSYLLPTPEVAVDEHGVTTGADDASDSPRPLLRWLLRVDVEVTSAALGAPLPHGVYEIDVQLLGLASEPAPVTVAWTACAPAVIDGVIVVPSPAVAPTLQLDVGPTSWPLVAGVEASRGSVTESAAGSLLILQLPDVHVSGTASIGGQLALDSLRLPAQIVTDGSSARMESFVSGLFGTPRLSTQFGDAPLKPSGLAVDVSGLGVMTVVKEKPAAKKAPAPNPPSPAKQPAKPVAAKPAQPAEKAAAKSGTTTPAAKKGAKKPAPKVAPKTLTEQPAPANPASTLQLARRALPGSLEPLIKRVAKNPVARRLYRKAGKLE